ncbi:type 1 glutamine amidotransferase [Sphingomonas sp. LR55]|uniref:type 1 glutamine amidotransferase n=1 Tax=Sphingomonas sp. LR55 TaxID=3050231 RepID=UPI002FE1E09F
MLNFLVAESETADEREARRRHAGKSSGETYAATLRQIRPGAAITIVAPADDDARVFDAGELRAFDAVFITGSPMHVYDDTPEVRRQIAFMRTVFASHTPSFGSCAGLQIAVAAAGGKVRKMPERLEAGIARRITPTAAGQDHPLLAGRPACWDAPAIHGDEVETLPADAILLASNAVTTVQAAEIRHDGGTFWGCNIIPNWHRARSPWRYVGSRRTSSNLALPKMKRRSSGRRRCSMRSTTTPNGPRYGGHWGSIAPSPRKRAVARSSSISSSISPNAERDRARVRAGRNRTG